jgi:hypothetical protein
MQARAPVAIAWAKGARRRRWWQVRSSSAWRRKAWLMTVRDPVPSGGRTGGSAPDPKGRHGPTGPPQPGVAKAGGEPLGGENLNGAVGFGVGYDGQVDLPPTQCVQRVAAGDVGRNAGHFVLEIADRQQRETGGDVVAKTNAQLAGVAIAQIAEAGAEAPRIRSGGARPRRAEVRQRRSGGRRRDALEHVARRSMSSKVWTDRLSAEGETASASAAFRIEPCRWISPDRVVDFQVFHGRAPVWCKKRTTAPQN